MNKQAIEEAVRSYLSQMSPEQLAKSNAYFEGGYWLLLWNMLLGLLLAYIFMRSGLSQNLRDRAHRWSRFTFVRGWLYAAQYIVLATALLFPMTVYQEYFREHKYGLSNLSFPAWLMEQTKALFVGLIMMGFFLALIYWLIPKFKKTWWIAGAVATTSFMAFAAMIAPVFLSPIFNDYKPLREGEARKTIFTMARSNGIEAEEIYEFDASKQSKRISANVSGLGKTLRISLNDNLLNRTSLPEIRAVMGHEMGHYLMGHVSRLIIYFGVAFFLQFFLLYQLMDWLLRRYGSRFGIQDIGDLAGLPALVAAFGLIMFLFTPVTNTIIRTQESQADLFGLNMAREADGFAKVSLQLSEYRKMSPGPLEEFVFYDHPSGETRIRMAMTWKAENTAPAVSPAPAAEAPKTAPK